MILLRSKSEDLFFANVTKYNSTSILLEIHQGKRNASSFFLQTERSIPSTFLPDKPVKVTNVANMIEDEGNRINTC